MVTHMKCSHFHSPIYALSYSNIHSHISTLKHLLTCKNILEFVLTHKLTYYFSNTNILKFTHIDTLTYNNLHIFTHSHTFIY